MNDLFTAIKNRLKEITKDDGTTPVFSQVEMWNNQYTYEDEQKLIKYPHAYVGISDPEWMQLGNKVQQATLLIEIYVGSRSLNEADVKHLELVDIVNYWLTGFSGTGFSSFTRVGMSFDQDHDFLISHKLTFKTVFKDTSAVRGKISVAGDKLEIIPEVVQNL